MQTIVVESSKDYTKDDNPAITVCGTLTGNHGWRNKSIVFQPFEQVCNGTDNAPETYDCIRNNTLDFSEIVYKTTDGHETSID